MPPTDGTSECYYGQIIGKVRSLAWFRLLEAYSRYDSMGYILESLRPKHERHFQRGKLECFDCLGSSVLEVLYL